MRLKGAGLRPRAARALDPHVPEAGGEFGVTQIQNGKSTMNIIDFKTVLANVMRFNERVIAGGGAVKDLIVPMAWGDPGLGKTDIAAATAEELGWSLVYADLATRDPAELAGLPWIKDGRSIRCRPDWLPSDGQGFLFLDELPQAGVANLNIAATLIREHRIGEHALAAGWMVVCAGNHPHNRAGTTTMPSHVRNRLMHITVEADVKVWASWAANRGVDPVLVAYNRYRAAEYRRKFSPADNAYPTPRTWAMSDQVLRLGLPSALEQECLSGTIGAAASADLAGFRRTCASLPDPDAIIGDPDHYLLPEDPATLYALMGALAHRAKAGTFAAIVRYLDRLPQQEFAVVCVLDATARDPALMTTSGYQRWAAAKGDLLTNR